MMKVYYEKDADLSLIKGKKVTIVGYGSLIAAHTQALRGFGMMAILGEVACLLAAVGALPSVYLWRQRRKAVG